MNVLVFRTNIGCTSCLETARQALRPYEDTIRWTVDLDDCDKVLRVETAGVSAESVVQAVQGAGFCCEELR